MESSMETDALICPYFCAKRVRVKCQPEKVGRLRGWRLVSPTSRSELDMFSKIKSHGVAKVLLAGCAFLAFSSAAWADQTHVAYNVAAGGTLAINVPGTNTPVSFTCSNNTSGDRGVGQSTILRVQPQAFLEWVSMDVFSHAVSSGYSGTLGAHIVYCDFGGTVDVQVLNDTQIQISNTSSVAESGVINFVW